MTRILVEDSFYIMSYHQQLTRIVVESSGISSGYEIDIDKFEEYSTKTVELCL